MRLYRLLFRLLPLGAVISIAALGVAGYLLATGVSQAKRLDRIERRVISINRIIEGKRGIPGRDGRDGARGPQGPPGRSIRGPRGPHGAQGPQGLRGRTVTVTRLVPGPTITVTHTVTVKTVDSRTITIPCPSSTTTGKRCPPKNPHC